MIAGHIVRGHQFDVALSFDATDTTQSHPISEDLYCKVDVRNIYFSLAQNIVCPGYCEQNIAIFLFVADDKQLSHSGPVWFVLADAYGSKLSSS